MCFKNYKAHKHNEILNKHRHNAFPSSPRNQLSCGRLDPIIAPNILLILS